MEITEKESTFLRKTVSTSLQNEGEHLIFILKSFYTAKLKLFMSDFRIVFSSIRLLKDPFRKTSRILNFASHCFHCVYYILKIQNLDLTENGSRNKNT